MQRSAPLLPILLTAFAVALLSLMDAFMKEAALAAGAYSATWARSVIGLGITAPVYLATRQSWPSRRVLRIHVLRGTCSALMALTFFFALTRLRLAEAIAISFVAPVLAIFLAAWLLHEQVGRRAYIAALLGLAGTLVIVGGRMSSEAMDPRNWAGLGALLVSAALYASNLVIQRKQAQLAGPLEISTSQNLMICLVLGIAAPFVFAMPSADALQSIAAASALTVGAQLLMAWTYARAEAQVLVPLEYTALIWAAAFGWLFFAETVTVSVLGGAVLIVLGCWIAALRKRPGPASEQAVV